MLSYCLIHKCHEHDFQMNSAFGYLNDDDDVFHENKQNGHNVNHGWVRVCLVDLRTLCKYKKYRCKAKHHRLIVVDQLEYDPSSVNTKNWWQLEYPRSDQSKTALTEFKMFGNIKAWLKSSRKKIPLTPIHLITA